MAIAAVFCLLTVAATGWQLYAIEEFEKHLTDNAPPPGSASVLSTPLPESTPGPADADTHAAAVAGDTVAQRGARLAPHRQPAEAAGPPDLHQSALEFLHMQRLIAWAALALAGITYCALLVALYQLGHSSSSSSRGGSQRRRQRSGSSSDNSTGTDSGQVPLASVSPPLARQDDRSL